MRSRERPSLSYALVLSCVLVAGESVAVQERRAAEASAQVRLEIDAGRYEDAEVSAERLVLESTTQSGAQSLVAAAASDLLVEALLRNGKGTQSRTRAVAESALQVKEALSNTDDVGLSISLRNLGNTLMVAGEVRQSIPLFERAVNIQEKTQGSLNLATASALDDLAAAQLQSDRYDDARRTLERAQGIKERILDPSDASVARTLELLALLLQRTGDYRAARPPLERALRIREAAPPNHPDLITTLNLLGTQCWFEGDPRSERGLYVRALAIGQNTLRPGHPLIAGILRNMAAPALTLGDLTEARSLQERALAIAEQSYGSSHPEMAEYLNDLASTYQLQGDYPKARSLYERAARIVEAHSGPNDLTLATYVYNLAILDARSGDLTEARKRLNRAVTIWQAVLGPDHPHVAIALSALGRRLVEQGAFSEAQLLFERALKIRERRLGPDHRDVARTLQDLAATHARQGRLSQALTLSARAIKIWERSDVADIPAFASILMLHANLQVDLGDFQAARHYYERALEIRGRVVGKSHPDYAQTQASLAAVLATLGEVTSAVTSALEAEETGRQHLRLTLRYLPERQSLSYAASRPKGLDLAMSLSSTNPDATNRVFDGLIKGRALVLDEMAARRRVSEDASRTDLAPLWAALASTRQRFANLIVKGPSDGRPERYAALVDDARRDKELAERALADSSVAFRDEIARGEIGLDDVRRALPAGSALVAFARYDRTSVPGLGAQAPQPTSTAARPAAPVSSYIAFVVREDQSQIALVPLGSASSVDTLVSRWHADILNIVGADSPSEVEKAYRVTGAALRRRLWDPVAGYLKDVSTVFVVPDGTLNLLSLAALPVGRTGYLIDQGPVIHYLSAERDLVTSSPAAASSRGLLAVGGAAFDDATLFTGKASKQRPVTRAPAGVAVAGGLRASCGDLASLTFDPLAGILQEVREVARLWSDSPADVLQDRGASEGAFKRAAPGHRVLHLATHGFFLGSTCRPAMGGTRAVGGLAPKRPGQSSAGIADNPLLLSGLALAGANRRAAAGPGDDDGILTAEEVAGLDLRGVEWAVLSACDTGLGEMKAGEGVFGLRRAFQIAGARTVIMSLWSVDDEATRLWMRALYEGRLKKHLSTADAMQQAGLSVLRARRARGETTHPFYWAGFVAAGDWR